MDNAKRWTDLSLPVLLDTAPDMNIEGKRVFVITGEEAVDNGQRQAVNRPEPTSPARHRTRQEQMAENLLDGVQPGIPTTAPY